MEARWADLPPELLAIISGGLPNAIDIIRFRHVCRSWRISTSPPPNKLSPFFPLTRVVSTEFHMNQRLTINERLTINAVAVYLLRPRSDPSKPWLVSLQEPVAGDLVPRHALRYDTFGGNNYSLDLSSDYWISATRICRFFEANAGRESKNSAKEVFRGVSCCTRLVGLRKIESAFNTGLLAFRVDLAGGDSSIASTRCLFKFGSGFQDFVKFNGRIYVFDDEGSTYLFEDKSLMLRRIKSLSIPNGRQYKLIRFVVLDGGLYVVLRSLWEDKCRVYKLERAKALHDQRWKGFSDLGDRVFFIAKNRSFWVRAPLLPPPWKPNSIVILNGRNHEVFQFGGGDDKFEMIASSSDNLFDPPSSWIDIQRDLASSDSRRRLTA